MADEPSLFATDSDSATSGRNGRPSRYSALRVDVNVENEVSSDEAVEDGSMEEASSQGSETPTDASKGGGDASEDSSALDVVPATVSDGEQWNRNVLYYENLSGQDTDGGESQGSQGELDYSLTIDKPAEGTLHLKTPQEAAGFTRNVLWDHEHLVTEHEHDVHSDSESASFSHAGSFATEDSSIFEGTMLRHAKSANALLRSSIRPGDNPYTSTAVGRLRVFGREDSGTSVLTLTTEGSTSTLSTYSGSSPSQPTDPNSNSDAERAVNSAKYIQPAAVSSPTPAHGAVAAAEAFKSVEARHKSRLEDAFRDPDAPEFSESPTKYNHLSPFAKSKRTSVIRRSSSVDSHDEHLDALGADLDIPKKSKKKKHRKKYREPLSASQEDETARQLRKLKRVYTVSDILTTWAPEAVVSYPFVGTENFRASFHSGSKLEGDSDDVNSSDEIPEALASSVVTENMCDRTLSDITVTQSYDFPSPSLGGELGDSAGDASSKAPQSVQPAQRIRKRSVAGPNTDVKRRPRRTSLMAVSTPTLSTLLDDLGNDPDAPDVSTSQKKSLQDKGPLKLLRAQQHHMKRRLADAKRQLDQDLRMYLNDDLKPVLLDMEHKMETAQSGDGSPEDLHDPEYSDLAAVLRDEREEAATGGPSSLTSQRSEAGHRSSLRRSTVRKAVGRRSLTMDEQKVVVMDLYSLQSFCERIIDCSLDRFMKSSTHKEVLKGLNEVKQRELHGATHRLVLKFMFLLNKCSRLLGYMLELHNRHKQLKRRKYSTSADNADIGSPTKLRSSTTFARRSSESRKRAGSVPRRQTVQIVRAPVSSSVPLEDCQLLTETLAQATETTFSSNSSLDASSSRSSSIIDAKSVGGNSSSVPKSVESPVLASLKKTVRLNESTDSGDTSGADVSNDSKGAIEDYARAVENDRKQAELMLRQSAMKHRRPVTKMNSRTQLSGFTTPHVHRVPKKSFRMFSNGGELGEIQGIAQDSDYCSSRDVSPSGSRPIMESLTPRDIEKSPFQNRSGSFSRKDSSSRRSDSSSTESSPSHSHSSRKKMSLWKGMWSRVFSSSKKRRGSRSGKKKLCSPQLELEVEGLRENEASPRIVVDSEEIESQMSAEKDGVEKRLISDFETVAVSDTTETPSPKEEASVDDGAAKPSAMEATHDIGTVRHLEELVEVKDQTLPVQTVSKDRRLSVDSLRSHTGRLSDLRSHQRTSSMDSSMTSTSASSTRRGRAGNRSATEAVELELLCRICEMVVPADEIEEHSRLCEANARVEIRALSCDDRLKNITKSISRKIAKNHRLHQRLLKTGGEIPFRGPPPILSDGDIEVLKQIHLLAENVENLSADRPESSFSCKQLLADIKLVMQNKEYMDISVRTMGERVLEIASAKQSLLEEKLRIWREKVDVMDNLPLLNEEAVRLLAKTSIRDFDILKPISRGGYGRVFLAQKRSSGDLYAIKAIRKNDIVQKNQVDRVLAERNIMALAENPFVVKFYYSFQGRDNLYLVMEYVPGGDVFSLLRTVTSLSENLARQFIAETVLALEYLHILNCVHRDLKPDNLLITQDGHIKLTDFGLSKLGLVDKDMFADLGRSPADMGVPEGAENEGREGEHGSDSDGDGTHHVVGTPDYVAPEILNGSPEMYSTSVDWWALGVIMFEFLTGDPPFFGSSKQEVFEYILTMDIPWEYLPEDVSPEARDLLEKLLTEDPRQRLGYNGAEEVKNHPWFKDVNWDTLLYQPSIYVPCVKESDTHAFDGRNKVFNVDDQATEEFLQQMIEDQISEDESIDYYYDDLVSSDEYSDTEFAVHSTSTINTNGHFDSTSTIQPFSYADVAKRSDSENLDKISYTVPCVDSRSTLGSVAPEEMHSQSDLDADSESNNNTAARARRGSHGLPPRPDVRLNLAAVQQANSNGSSRGPSPRKDRRSGVQSGISVSSVADSLASARASDYSHDRHGDVIEKFDFYHVSNLASRTMEDLQRQSIARRGSSSATVTSHGSMRSIPVSARSSQNQTRTHSVPTSPVASPVSSPVHVLDDIAALTSPLRRLEGIRTRSRSSSVGSNSSEGSVNSLTRASRRSSRRRITGASPTPLISAQTSDTGSGGEGDGLRDRRDARSGDTEVATASAGHTGEAANGISLLAVGSAANGYSPCNTSDTGSVGGRSAASIPDAVNGHDSNDSMTIRSFDVEQSSLDVSADTVVSVPQECHGDVDACHSTSRTTESD